MSYYFSKTVKGDFDDVIELVMARLKEQGFGVLTHIDVQDTLRQKLDVEFQPYVILGACNPPFAHKALTIEDKIGTLLPCNVIIQKVADNTMEVAAVDPVASMAAIDNPEVEGIAKAVQERLKLVLDSLS
jgi:uncharacterized protein (DUF302 family)